MSTYTDASLIVTPNSKKAGKLYALKGADLDVVRATTATYVGADGLIKTALANEVRFDYTNGSCPSILVEPQRTNLALRSEEFDSTSWVKQNSDITKNFAISPDGTMDADLCYPTSAGSFRGFRQSSTSSTGLRAKSIFAKQSGKTRFYIRFDDSIYVIFDLANGTILDNTTPYTPKIENYGNGWYRCTAVNNMATSSSSMYIGIINTVYPSVTPNGTDGVIFWGAQDEVGSSATSYIPTVASAVTRNADVISKTGLSGITSITETFENGTTNVISGSPTSYTMSQGRIKHVIGI